MSNCDIWSASRDLIKLPRLLTSNEGNSYRLSNSLTYHLLTNMKSPSKPVRKSPLKQTKVSFKPAVKPKRPPARPRTPPPLANHPITPPDTPEQPKINLNNPIYVREYARIEKEHHIASPLFKENVSAAEKILLHFDMSIQFGPTVGMTRLFRWNRAHDLDLNPPQIVFQILSQAPDSELNQPYSHGRI